MVVVLTSVSVGESGLKFNLRTKIVVVLTSVAVDWEV